MEQWATITLITGGSLTTLFFLVRLIEVSRKLVKEIRVEPGAPSVRVERDDSPVVTVEVYERLRSDLQTMASRVEDTHRIARQSEAKLNRVDDGISELLASSAALRRLVDKMASR